VSNVPSFPTERRILDALLNKLRVAGFLPAAVWTGESYVLATSAEPDGTVLEWTTRQPPKAIARGLTNDEVHKIFADYDMYAPTVHFTRRHNITWGNHGVMVVPGNGIDFISDWHCGNADFDAIVDSVSSAQEAFA